MKKPRVHCMVVFARVQIEGCFSLFKLDTHSSFHFFTVATLLVADAITKQNTEDAIHGPHNPTPRSSFLTVAGSLNNGMRQQSTPCPHGAQPLGQAIARAAATPSGQPGMPTQDPPLLKLLPATRLPKPEKSAGTPRSRRAVLSTTAYRSEPTANESRGGAPGAAQTLQSGPGIQDPLCFPSPPLSLGVRRAPHPALRAAGPGSGPAHPSLPSRLPQALPLPGAAPRRRAAGPSHPPRIAHGAGRGRGDPRKGRGRRPPPAHALSHLSATCRDT